MNSKRRLSAYVNAVVGNRWYGRATVVSHDLQATNAANEHTGTDVTKLLMYQVRDIGCNEGEKRCYFCLRPYQTKSSKFIPQVAMYCPDCLRLLQYLENDGFKRCQGCNQLLPISEFHKARSKDGHRHKCKECDYTHRLRVSIMDAKRRGDPALEIWPLVDELEARLGKTEKQYWPEKRRPNKPTTKRSELLAQMPNTFTDSDWRYALRWWWYRCAVCGKWGFDILHRDHWIPVNAYPDCPGTIPENIIPLCKNCNSSKSDKAPELWLHERYGEPIAQRKLARVNRYFRAVERKNSLVSSSETCTAGLAKGG